MKKIFLSNIITLCTFMSLSISVFAEDYTAGSRASFTRGAWAGAKYTAMGRTGVVMANDVYSIYWNPAGLSELKGKKRLSIQDIQKRAKDGKVGTIKEDDLTRFTENIPDDSIFQIGTSGTLLDAERNVGFFGTAFNMFSGIFGLGLYSISSLNIEGRDESGKSTGNINYVTAVGFFSYGVSLGASSIGMSLKYLYENIDEVTYMGGGVDIGAQLYALPFLKIAFMIQDLGTGLYPIESYNDIEKKYDLASPSLHFAVSLDTGSSGVDIAFGLTRRLEQQNFNYTIGLQYAFSQSANLYIGMGDKYFSTGIAILLRNLEISYAFEIDNIDLGYNNTVSLTLLL